MALTSAGLFGEVWGLLSTSLPTVNAAFRVAPNIAPTLAVPPHNPMMKMVQYSCIAWDAVLKATPVTNTYAGVVGGTATAPPVPITFTMTASAGAALASTLGWIGPSSLPVANALTTYIAVATNKQAQYLAAPVPGGGMGTGAITPANTTPLLATGPAFYAALRAAYMSELLFTIGDLKVTLTPQIEILIGALSGIYSQLFASIVTPAPIPYAGGTAPSPLTVPMATGKII